MFTVIRRQIVGLNLLLGASLLLASGCASPFGRKDLPPLPSAAAATMPANGPGTGPQQASYQSPAGPVLPDATDSVMARYPDPDTRFLPPKMTEDSGWGIFSTSAVTDSYKKMTGAWPNHDESRKFFADGEALFRQAKYDDASSLFLKAARKWPDSPIEEDALFFEAECQFFSDRYSKANDSYAELLKKYSNSRYLDRSIARKFAIALYWEKSHRANPHWVVTPNFTDKTRPWFDTEGNAIAVWNDVRLKDPTGPLADDAVMATANAYFIDGQWEEADYYYSIVRRDYPKSNFQVQAHLLGLQCKLKKYQGPEYDNTPLKEANDLIDTMLKQFPNELQGERERLLAARTDLRGQLAQRDWNRAEYFAKSDHIGAARIYYDSIVKEYPGSNVAQLAQDRMNYYKDKPDQPDSSFAIVRNLFTSPPPANIATAPKEPGTVQR